MGDGKKALKMLVIAIGVIVVITLLAFGYRLFVKDDGVKFSDKYLIIGSSVIYQKTTTGWKQIKSVNKKIQNQKYSVVSNGQNFDDLSLQFVDNKWYFLDNDYNDVDIDGNFVAFSNLNVDVANFEEEDVSYDQFQSQMLELMGEDISKIDDYNFYKINIDINNDGVSETIYYASNFMFDSVDYTMHSGYFYLSGGKLSKIITTEDYDLSIEGIVDMDNDGNYELVIADEVLNQTTFDSSYVIYKLKDDKWVKTM